jgi:hypothetical protein
VSDVVVQLVQRPRDNAVAFLPRTTLRENGFANPCQDERVEKRSIRLVGEHVAMMLAISLWYVNERDVGRRGRLSDIAKRRRPRFVEFLRPGNQPRTECVARGFRHLGRKYRVGVVQGPLKLRVGPAVGEIQITEQCLRWNPLGKPRQGGVHRMPSEARRNETNSHQNSGPSG